MGSKVEALATILLVSLLSLASLSVVTSTPHPMMSPPPPSTTCPNNTTDLKVCVDLMRAVRANVDISPNDPSRECCTLIEGLVDLEAIACLCIAADVNVGQIVNLNATVSVALEVCNRNIPLSDIKCPN
nr:14 kDa proline-rich protein DC2.15-like [Ipomoea batatas]